MSCCLQIRIEFSQFTMSYTLMFVMFILWVYIHTGQAWKIYLATVGIEPTTFGILANCRQSNRDLSKIYFLKLLSIQRASIHSSLVYNRHLFTINFELSPRRKRAWRLNSKGLNSKGLTRKIPTPIFCTTSFPGSSLTPILTGNFTNYRQRTLQVQLLSCAKTCSFFVFTTIVSNSRI
jgi:hypothetical protein